MNKQQMFDIAAKGILSQGKASFSKTDQVCMYRNNDGCKCAIGWLIPDSKYIKELENQSLLSEEDLYVVSLNVCEHVKMIAKAAGIRKGQYTFANELQFCHDDAFSDGDFIRGFKIAMKDLAHKYKLSTKVLEN